MEQGRSWGGTVSGHRQEPHSHREWETKASKGSSIPCGRGTAVCAPNPLQSDVRLVDSHTLSMAG